jgi:hypothetical protein
MDILIGWTPDEIAWPAREERSMTEAQELRRLAIWYREFAERAGNPWIWDARLRHADEIEKEAARLEEIQTRSSGQPVSPRHK